MSDITRAMFLDPEKNNAIAFKKFCLEHYSKIISLIQNKKLSSGKRLIEDEKFSDSVKYSKEDINAIDDYVHSETFPIYAYELSKECADKSSKLCGVKKISINTRDEKFGKLFSDITDESSIEYKKLSDGTAVLIHIGLNDKNPNTFFVGYYHIKGDFDLIKELVESTVESDLPTPIHELFGFGGKNNKKQEEKKRTNTKKSISITLSDTASTEGYNIFKKIFDSIVVKMGNVAADNGLRRLVDPEDLDYDSREYYDDLPKEDLKLKDMDYFKKSVSNAKKILSEEKDNTSIIVILEADSAVSSIDDNYFSDILDIWESVFRASGFTKINGAYTIKEFFSAYYKKMSDCIVIVGYGWECPEFELMYKCLALTDKNISELSIKEATIFDECVFI